jgi:hypothetical protein
VGEGKGTMCGSLELFNSSKKMTRRGRHVQRGWYPLVLQTAYPHRSLSFTHTNKPATGHMKAALYILHYIHSTHDYGISFTSNNIALLHSYVHFPPLTNAKAYDDIVLPTLGLANTLLAYSNACWGSQLGSSVANGTLLPLFKLQSMNGGIIFKNGGPIG